MFFKSIAVAFSMYSKIPMPRFEWKNEDMKYMLCFFPWIGAVIGGLVFFWAWLCDRIGIGFMCYSLIGTVIPLLITGGFHVDGFMDTMDALHSYQPRERKLEILKDSHIGAFAVIMLATYGLIYIAAFSYVDKGFVLGVFCAGFFLSRTLSGLGVVYLKGARTNGMLFESANNAHKRNVKIALFVQLFACMAFMIWLEPLTGSVLVITALLSFAFYRWKSYKEFGGITGDTAGYFVLICECAMCVAAAIISILVNNVFIL